MKVLKTNISSEFVSVGSTSFEVEDKGIYQVGDHIVIYHPDSEAWLQAVNYGATGTHANAEPWSKGEVEVQYNRYIKAIEENQITIDAPVFMHLDRSLSQSYIYKLDENAAWTTKNVGIENFRIELATNGLYAEEQASTLVKFQGVENFWANEITGVRFVRSLISCGAATRGTIRNCKALEPHSPIKGGRRYNYLLADEVQLVLVENSYSAQGRHDLTCGGSGRFASCNSGNVFLNCIIAGAFDASDNHVRWYTGILHDNNQWVNHTGGNALDFANRGHWSGQAGYTSAHCTTWNCRVDNGRLNIQGAPTAQNYAIGCSADEIGNFKIRSFFGDAPDGYYEGNKKTGLFPASLYLAQLRQRLNPDFNANDDVPVGGVNLFEGDLNLRMLQSAQLIASVYPVDAANKVLKWKSTDPSVVTVADGMVTAVASGKTNIIVTTVDGNHSDTSAVTVNFPVDINDESAVFELCLSPNPVTEKLILKGSIKNVQIKVLDFTGKLILQRQFIADEMVIDLSELPPGIYFVGMSELGIIRKFLKL